MSRAPSSLPRPKRIDGSTRPGQPRYIGRRVSALGPVASSFNVTVPTSGVAFTTVYDVWSSDHAHEIMLWMNKYGPVGPLGSFQVTAAVGGHSWNIYRGSNGSNQVYSFIRTSNTNSGGRHPGHRDLDPQSWLVR
ncbi:hypothetical protein ACFP2T_20800 [Plantactinospora solaniradicis]|uniref:Glycosyl hydrolase family 12 n=1 Tax=Plantactinospora solaniradicis TaxID=1723736 RepID=A0ABW1KCS6_9ACTN